jgi:hypothetical protein
LDETSPVTDENTTELVESIEDELKSDGLIRVEAANLSNILAQFN